MFLLTCVCHLVFTVTNRLREKAVKTKKAAGDEKLLGREIINMILVGVKLFYEN